MMALLYAHEPSDSRDLESYRKQTDFLACASCFDEIKGWKHQQLLPR